MDVDIVKQLLVPIIEIAITPIFIGIGHKLSYAFCYNRNIQNLGQIVADLENLKKDADSFFEGQQCNNEETAESSNGWLKGVIKVIEDANEVQEASANIKGCLNIKGRYVLSRNSTKLALKIEKLERETPKEITPGTVLPVGRLPGASANNDSSSYKTRMQTLEEVMKALEDHAISIVGICGLGGIGKTPMVHEIRERARQKNLFIDFAISTVSRNPDIFQIQGDLAGMLALHSLNVEKNVHARADQIRKRLTSGKKSLLILDDVWRDINLKDVGIPVGTKQTKCKVIIASRHEGVCTDIQKTIKVQVLAKEEARDLFWKKEGQQVQKNTFGEIADEVVDECGGLPIALLALKKELLNKDMRGWEDARTRLRTGGLMSINGMEEVYESLKLSYDFLAEKKQEEAQSLLLLCCQHQEDDKINVEKLAQDCLSLGLFEGVTGVVQARNRVYTLIEHLKSCLLLEAVDADDEAVKMHCVVRYVCLSILSREKEEREKTHMHIGGTQGGLVLGGGSTESGMSRFRVSGMPTLEAQKMIDEANRAIKDNQHAAEVANKVAEDLQARVEEIKAAMNVLASQSNPHPDQQGS